MYEHIFRNAQSPVRNPFRGRVLGAASDLLNAIFPNRYLINEPCGQQLPKNLQLGSEAWLGTLHNIGEEWTCLEITGRRQLWIKTRIHTREVGVDDMAYLRS